MKDIEDRFLDVALEEVLGEAPPPDLTDQVLGLIHEGRVPTPATRATPRGARLLRLPSPRAQSSPRKVIGWSAVPVVVLLLLWGGSRLFPDRSNPEAVSELQVLHGVVQWTGKDSSLWANAGETLELHMGPGDRINFGEDSAVLRIGPFAVLHTRPNTILEVMTMQTSRKNGVIAVSALTLAVVAGAVTWDRLFRVDEAEVGEVLRLEGPLEGMPDVRHDMMGRLTEQNEALQRRIDDLESQLSRKALAATSSGNVEAEDEPSDQEIRFATDKFREALSNVDWQRLGTTLDELSRINAKIAEHSLEGGEMPSDILAKHKQLSGLLLELGQPLVDGGIPGEGGNGMFSHPLVLANSTDFALAAAGMPLEQSQIDWLQSITQHYAAQDENLRISAESEGLASESFLAEMKMKRDLYGEIRGILTLEQQELLFPKAARGRAQLELFGVGGDWGKFARRVMVRGPEEYTNVMTVSFQSSLGLSDQQTAQLRIRMGRYARSYPDSYWDKKSSEQDRRGFMETSRIHVAAERQIALLRDILQNVDLTPQQREVLAKTRNVLVPLPR